MSSTQQERSKSPKEAARDAPNRAEGGPSQAVDVARNRLIATGLILMVAFSAVAIQLGYRTLVGGGGIRHAAAAVAPQPVSRGDIVDRNGVVLATSLPTASLYADAKDVIDPAQTVAALAQVLPGIDRTTLQEKLSGKGRFIWIQRNLTPDEQYAVNRLGLPGLKFETEYRRIYPRGCSAAHILGLTDIDEFGIAGIERTFDALLANGETVRLSLDVRVQDLLRDELLKSVHEFRAIGAAGLVLDIETGELLASVSLPDFDPNAPGLAKEEARFNRVTKGVYEMGSVFKLFTVAMALDSGVTTLKGGYNAARPLRVGNHTISDYHAKNRWLSVPEILVHSSNIGSALMASAVGTTLQRQYLQRFGLTTPAVFDLPEVGEPLVPHPWREVNTMTVGFGHGIAITPLQLGTGVAALVNGGIYRPATILYQDDAVAAQGRRVISARTSRQMRDLMRLVVQHGTGTRAEVAGYQVGGKTGTADKLINGHYRTDKRVSSFVGAFPMAAPRYVVFVMIDEPKGTKKTFNYATGGWVAAPLVGRIVEKMAPIVGLPPMPDAIRPTIEAASPKGENLAVAIQRVIANEKDQRIAAR